MESIKCSQDKINKIRRDIYFKEKVNQHESTPKKDSEMVQSVMKTIRAIVDREIG